MQPLYTETQGLGWWVVILLVLIIGIIAWRVFFVARTSKYVIPKGVKVFMGVVLLIPTAALFITLSAKLKTTIDKEGVHYKFFPLVNNEHTVHWQDISKVYVRQYKPIKEYGGWGVRNGGEEGVAYNAAGDQGLQLILKNGKKILIGTQKPGELKAALTQLVKDKVIADSIVSE